MSEASPCQQAACAGWCSWAAAWVRLLITTKTWEGAVYHAGIGVLKRVGSAFQEGEGTI